MSEVTTRVGSNEFETDAQNMKLTKLIKISSQNVGYIRQTAQQASASGATFKINVSRNQLLSRRVLFEIPFTLTVTGANTTSGVRHFGSCLKSDAANRLITNLNVRINGGSVISQPSQYCELIQFYDRDFEDYNSGHLALAPNVPDKRVVRNLAIHGVTGTFDNFDQVSGTGSDARLHHFRSLNSTNVIEPSRGSWFYEQSKPTYGVNNDTEGNTPLTRKYVALYALKNPVFSSSDFDVLANVNDLEIQLSFDSQPLQRCFLHTLIKTGTVGDGENGTPSCTISATQSDYIIHMRTYTPNSLDEVPPLQIVPGQRFTVNDSGARSMAPSTATPFVHPTIRTPQVPEAIFIACTVADSAKTSTLSDCFAEISNLKVKVNQKPMDFQAYTTSTFYEMCCRNGLKQRYQDFDPRATTAVDGIADTAGVGMVLCIKPSRDLGGDLAENLISGEFTLDVEYSAKHYVTGLTADFVSRVCLVQASLYTLEADKPIMSIDGISRDEYDRAYAAGKVLGVFATNDGKEMVGGSFFKDFAHGFKKGWKMVMSPAAQIAEAIGPLGGPEGIAAAKVLNVASNLGGAQLGGAQLGGVMSRNEQLRRAGLAR